MISILSSFFASILTIPMLAQETDSGISYSSSATGQISPIVWVIDVVVIILIIAAMWKIFAKAGQPGWAAIIPIYNLRPDPVVRVSPIAGNIGWSCSGGLTSVEVAAVQSRRFFIPRGDLLHP